MTEEVEKSSQVRIREVGEGAWWVKSGPATVGVLYVYSPAVGGTSYYEIWYLVSNTNNNGGFAKWPWTVNPGSSPVALTFTKIVGHYIGTPDSPGTLPTHAGMPVTFASQKHAVTVGPTVQG